MSNFVPGQGLAAVQSSGDNSSDHGFTESNRHWRKSNRVNRSFHPSSKSKAGNKLKKNKADRSHRRTSRHKRRGGNEDSSAGSDIDPLEAFYADVRL